MALQNFPISIGTDRKINFVGDNASGAAPNTNLLAVPVSVDIYGGPSVLMGKPAGWTHINVSGNNYRIPFYN